MEKRYIFILIWIGFFYLLSKSMSFQHKETVLDENVERYNWTIAIIIFIPVVWMAANRGQYFSDSALYAYHYDNDFQPVTFEYIKNAIKGQGKDWGYGILVSTIKRIFGGDYKRYFMVMSVLQGIPLIKFLRKYSSNYIFSFFLFIAATDYIGWMFNGMRQFTAIVIVLLAAPYMFEKKYVRAILLVLLAMTMHQSAMIVIPFIFIAQGKAFNKKTMLFILGAILAVTFVTQFSDILGDALENTQYDGYIEKSGAWNSGTSPFRVIIYSFPALFAFYGRKTIREKGGTLINFCANMSVATAGIYLIAMFTSGILMGRVPGYFFLFGYVLLPWEIENLFPPATKKTVYFCTIAGYLAYYYNQAHGMGVL